jgi:hypothetical protein
MVSAEVSAKWWKADEHLLRPQLRSRGISRRFVKLCCHAPKPGYLQVSDDGEMSRWGDLCRRALIVRSRFGLLASPHPPQPPHLHSNSRATIMRQPHFLTRASIQASKPTLTRQFTCSSLLRRAFKGKMAFLFRVQHLHSYRRRCSYPSRKARCLTRWTAHKIAII